MPEINMNNLYPRCVGDEKTINVSDELFELLTKTFPNEEAAYEKRIKRNKADNEYIEGRSECDMKFKQKVPLEEIIVKEEVDELYRALSHMTAVQQERFLLHYKQGLTFCQIADIEGVDESAVRHSVERGIKRLKKFYKKI